MARIYAGILGPLALLTSLAHGALHRRSQDAILETAWVSLVVFAVLGLGIGWIAQRVVDEEVRSRIAAESDAQEPASPGKA